MTPFHINVSEKAKESDMAREIDIERKPWSFPCFGSEAGNSFNRGTKTYNSPTSYHAVDFFESD